MRHISRAKTIVGAAVFAALATAGAAGALWSATGTGSGRASSLSAVALTVTAATGTADLYPGFTQGKVFFTVTNTNPYPVTFTSYTASAVVSSDIVNCPSINVTVLPSGTTSLAVAANAVATPLSIANIVTMLATAPDGCQGKTFNITLTLTGSQT